MFVTDSSAMKENCSESIVISTQDKATNDKKTVQTETSLENTTSKSDHFSNFAFPAAVPRPTKSSKPSQKNVETIDKNKDFTRLSVQTLEKTQMGNEQGFKQTNEEEKTKNDIPEAKTAKVIHKYISYLFFLSM